VECQSGKAEVLEQLSETADGGDGVSEHKCPVLGVIEQESVEIKILDLVSI
jgi:hypothetical protein